MVGRRRACHRRACSRRWNPKRHGRGSASDSFSDRRSS